MRNSPIYSAGPKAYVPAALLLACLVAQLYLVLFKSFNWDEFLHFSEVYKARAGTLSDPFQVLHARILWWAPDMAANLIDQMRLVRVFMWLMELVTLSAIYGVARRFTQASNAFFASFAYLTAGYVFTQGFSVRADPMTAATLMSALFLLAKGELRWIKSIVIGALLGAAGMMTVKAIFYVPCFAGLAWLKFGEAANKAQLLGNLMAAVISAALSFGAIYLYHTSHLAHVAGLTQPVPHTSFLSFFLRWITADLPFADYIRFEIILAPLFFFAVALAPFAWKKTNLKFDEKLALAGFMLPLATLLFYRNTFPYFFVFLLAPVAVAIAPALGLVRERYGSVFLAIFLSAAPIALAILEPRHMIDRQRTLIDYVHREFPKKTGYLDYSAMIADYPRVFEHLTSGNGIRAYHDRGDAVVGMEIDRGNVPFIIANQEVIQNALEGHPVPNTFLPADLAAMNGNYVRQWGVLWREGTRVPGGRGAFEFRLRRGGEFVVDGDSLTIDGAHEAHGTRVALSKGRHVIAGGRRATSILWRGDRLPTTPPDVPMDSVFTNF